MGLLVFLSAPSISTHAPAGGATHRVIVFLYNAVISTHAPAGGATGTGKVSVMLETKFLLTPLREGRQLASAV